MDTALEEETVSGSAAGDRGPLARDDEVTVQAGQAHVGGHLTVPEEAAGLVIFAHGSGSSRFSHRNMYVADVLNGAGFATLMFDLLTTEEEADRANVFDIELLGRRLVEVTEWVSVQSDVSDLTIGYFGASTGAAAALVAATASGVPIAAVVSRGGRPDLAGERLGAVGPPTLLIVGGNDPAVLDLNRQAQTELQCLNELVVIPGAAHLFEEPGALAAVAQAAQDWFLRHLHVDGAAANDE